MVVTVTVSDRLFLPMMDCACCPMPAAFLWDHLGLRNISPQVSYRQGHQGWHGAAAGTSVVLDQGDTAQWTMAPQGTLGGFSEHDMVEGPGLSPIGNFANEIHPRSRINEMPFF